MALQRLDRRLVLRLARENPLQGYRRIQSELAKPGVTIAPSMVWEIRRGADLDPAPRCQGPAWRKFLLAQAAGILAADFRHAGTVLMCQPRVRLPASGPGGPPGDHERAATEGRELQGGRGHLAAKIR